MLALHARRVSVSSRIQSDISTVIGVHPPSSVAVCGRLCHPRRWTRDSRPLLQSLQACLVVVTYGDEVHVPFRNNSDRRSHVLSHRFEVPAGRFTNLVKTGIILHPVGLVLNPTGLVLCQPVLDTGKPFVDATETPQPPSGADPRASSRLHPSIVPSPRHAVSVPVARTVNRRSSFERLSRGENCGRRNCAALRSRTLQEAHRV